MTTSSTVQTSASGSTYLTSTISGIDTQALITAAVNAKLVKKTRLTDQVGTNTNKIAAYQDLQTESAALQSSLNKLRSTTTGSDTNALTAKQVNYLSSDSTTDPTNVLTATSDATAQAGSHKIIVTHLAEALTATSDEQSSGALGYSGTFDIGEAGKTAATITVSATSTIQDIAAAINNTTATSGVKADILQTADGKYKLVISGNDTAKAVTVSNVTGTDVLTGIGATDSTHAFVHVSQAAQQAQISVDGTTVYSDTNKISNVLTGLTLNLTNTAPSTTLTVTVGNNTDGVKAALQDFVSNYNKLRQAIVAYQGINSSGGATSSSAYLYNDPVSRSFTQNLGALLTASYGGGSNYQSLGALGITLDSSNNLVLDETTLDSALTNNYSDVTRFFASNAGAGTTGFADTLYTMLDGYSNSGTGTFAKTIANLQSLDANLTSQADDVQTAADAFQQSLIEKYAKLETQMQAANLLKAQIDAILKGSTQNNN